jgi:hypothetical protein
LHNKIIKRNKSLGYHSANAFKQNHHRQGKVRAAKSDCLRFIWQGLQLLPIRHQADQVSNRKRRSSKCKETHHGHIIKRDKHPAPKQPREYR